MYIKIFFFSLCLRIFYLQLITITLITLVFSPVPVFKAALYTMHYTLYTIRLKCETIIIFQVQSNMFT